MPIRNVNIRRYLSRYLLFCFVNPLLKSIKAFVMLMFYKLDENNNPIPVGTTEELMEMMEKGELGVEDMKSMKRKSLWYDSIDEITISTVFLASDEVSIKKPMLFETLLRDTSAVPQFKTDEDYEICQAIQKVLEERKSA